MQFTLTIELGNAAMSTPEHVGEAIGNVAERLRGGQAVGGFIRDVNGNTVGRYGADEWPEAEIE